MQEKECVKCGGEISDNFKGDALTKGMCHSCASIINVLVRTIGALEQNHYPDRTVSINIDHIVIERKK